MEYPPYAVFTARFGEGPEEYFEKLSLAQMRCIAEELEIAFQPPFNENEQGAVVHRAIIDAAVGDYQEPGQDKELIRAVENCMRQGTM